MVDRTTLPTTRPPYVATLLLPLKHCYERLRLIDNSDKAAKLKINKLEGSGTLVEPAIKSGALLPRTSSLKLSRTKSNSAAPLLAFRIAK